MQKIYSSRSRLERVAWDIIQDFDLKPRLMDGNGNAILVADSIYTACKYYEIFQQRGFKKCAIISSYTPQAGDLRTDTVSADDETETFEKYEIYLRMLGFDPDNLPEKVSIQKKVEDFEKEVKEKFVNEPANMKLLIVVDKLLTGFDAPPCTYLYIDKSMQDHGLFQAICRVNRLDGDTKEFGYIVDYKQLFGNLKNAMDKYTSGAFENYAPEDVDGLLKDRGDEAIKHFKDIYEDLEELCEGVEAPREDLQYLHYFCGVSGMSEDMDEIYARLREKLYKLVSSLVRAYAEAKQYMVDICSATELNAYENKVHFYIELKQTIGNKSGDFLDFKAYEPDMRKLIDNYIMASDSIKIGEFDDLTLLDFVMDQGETMTGEDTPSGQKEGAAEAIENNIRRKMVEKVTVNPKYYEKMSAILDKLIQDRQKGVLSYKELLDEYIKLAKNVDHPEENEDYPESVRHSKAMQALVVFEDGNIKDKNKNIVIRNAKRGTVLIDPRVYYERTLGTVNFTIAHECFHWYRHQPYHALMKMLGANDELGKIIQCSIGSNAKDSEKWKAVDWMEWQANGVAPHILMPTNTAKIKISELVEKYHIHFDGTDGYQIEEMISELADFYGLSKQAVKMRIREMGFAKVDGAFTYVNGQYVTPFSFDASALTDNQSFTISSADLFKAYCLNKDFRKAIDTGKFVYVEGHVCLDDEKYIIHSEGRVKLTQYALSHMDECCLAFDKGYSYQSKYQGQKYYVQMMYKTPSQVAAQEYSFEMNAHNRTLLSQIQRASRSADAMRLYPGSFSETLVQLMKEKKLSNKKLADASLVGERTIQRLRNEEEYPTTVQTILGLCYGLQLSVPEAEMLVGKTDFNIKPTNPQNNAYRCVLSSCAENSIYEVNEMLESCGFEPLGSSKMG